MSWTHERAAGRGGTESWSPLLHRPELLFPGLAPLRPVVPPDVQLPPCGQERSKTSAQGTAPYRNPVGAVRGPDVKRRPRKGKGGAARHKEVSGPAREVGDSSPGLAHTPIPGGC